MKIGIDLGTTNSALAYIDEREAEDRDFPPLHIFETPQLVAPDASNRAAPCPRSCYLEDGQPVGVYAREQGALVPTRLVHSAKSWLSNPDVDRTAKILPWDSPGDRARALARGSLRAHHRQVPRGVGQGQRHPARRAGHRAHRARVLRRRGARTHRDGRARCRHSKS